MIKFQLLAVLFVFSLSLENVEAGNVEADNVEDSASELAAQVSGASSGCAKFIDENFVFHSDGKVSDKVTGHTWRRCPVGQDFDKLNSRCEGRALTFSFEALTRHFGAYGKPKKYNGFVKPDIGKLEALFRASPCDGSTFTNRLFPADLKSDVLFWSTSSKGNSRNESEAMGVLPFSKRVSTEDKSRSGIMLMYYPNAYMNKVIAHNRKHSADLVKTSRKSIVSVLKLHKKFDGVIAGRKTSRDKEPTVHSNFTLTLPDAPSFGKPLTVVLSWGGGEEIFATLRFNKYEILELSYLSPSKKMHRYFIYSYSKSRKTMMGFNERVSYLSLAPSLRSNGT
ncbi:MAG: hypothetical protein COA42_11825 [Alteromonadaceae bacterium]|nr:MAG: hypothetical protein COA42_11825 [Alteromonadaceae bacterium]